MKKLSILGIGNFGYAILKHLENCHSDDYDIHAFDQDQDLMTCLKETRRHKYLHQEVSITDAVTFESSYEELAHNCDIMVLAVSSQYLHSTLRNLKPHFTRPIQLINTAKALSDDGYPLSQVVADAMGETPYEYAILAGGTIASDLFKHEPLGIDLACTNINTATSLATLFRSQNLAVYPTSDVIGVEYASSFKNVISILSGIIKGMGFSYGSQTHLISRAADEVAKLVTTELGGNHDTFTMGRQCWGNDLWMSCTGGTRNREFGMLLGQGVSVDDALSKMEKDGVENEVFC